MLLFITIIPAIITTCCYYILFYYCFLCHILLIFHFNGFYVSLVESFTIAVLFIMIFSDSYMDLKVVVIVLVVAAAAFAVVVVAVT